MTVRVTVNQGALDRLLRRRGGAAERRLRERTERVAEIARSTGPFKPEAIRSSVEPSGRGLKGVVEINHRAAIFVTRGTRPHVIRARRARALRFQPRGQNGYIFRKSVQHPGNLPNDFLQRALRQVVGR